MCFVLKSFCCFISVEVGAQLISIISTLLSVLIAVLYASAAVFLKLSLVKLCFYTSMAVAAVLQCVCASLLSYGAFENRPKYMWPWLIIALFTGLSLLAISVGGTVVLIVDDRLSKDVNIVILAYFLYSLFLLYCACIVNSRRVQLVKEQKQVDTAQALMRNHNSWRYY